MNPCDLELGVLYLKSFFAGSLNLMVVLLRAQRASFCTFPHEVESASIAGASRAWARRREKFNYYLWNILEFASSHHILLLKTGSGKYNKWVNIHHISRWKNLGEEFFHLKSAVTSENRCWTVKGLQKQSRVPDSECYLHNHNEEKKKQALETSSTIPVSHQHVLEQRVPLSLFSCTRWLFHMNATSSSCCCYSDVWVMSPIWNVLVLSWLITRRMFTS